MDVFISEEYVVVRRQEMKKMKMKQRLVVQTERRRDQAFAVAATTGSPVTTPEKSGLVASPAMSVLYAHFTLAIANSIQLLLDGSSMA
ncbi:hypothetical protein H6P81_013493 [Aristolochia fimbriata]|uniref:Uncharacterized protein n=1 Tax=Aristolochia fimbriata TaxID=158543 RepID=A0AAV7EEW1_ARIFI|nr:hypothetical protein H6P81_013493 [Aristolochia fimbriata]